MPNKTIGICRARLLQLSVPLSRVKGKLAGLVNQAANGGDAEGAEKREVDGFFYREGELQQRGLAVHRGRVSFNVGELHAPNPVVLQSGMQGRGREEEQSIPASHFSI